MLKHQRIEGLVLSASKDQGVASLYHTKKLERKNKINEENTFAVQLRQKHPYEGEGNYEVKT